MSRKRCTLLSGAASRLAMNLPCVRRSCEGATRDAGAGGFESARRFFTEDLQMVTDLTALALWIAALLVARLAVVRWLSRGPPW